MISIIAAVASNGVIGGGNSILWHITEDFRRFRCITTGHPVIMGRRTFESIGRPLPQRTNVVITRQRGYRPEGVLTAASLEEALALFPPSEEVFVIGGGSIYEQAMPLADRLYLTEVMHAYEGDTRFPTVDSAHWEPVSSERHERGAEFPYPFVFRDYRRR